MYWGEEEGDDHHPGSDDQVKKGAPSGRTNLLVTLRVPGKNVKFLKSMKNEHFKAKMTFSQTDFFRAKVTIF